MMRFNSASPSQIGSSPIKSSAVTNCSKGINMKI